MLVINKDCTFYTIEGMTVERWLNKRKLSDMGGDIVIAIDDDNELFQRVINAPRFDILYDEDGDFLDIQELPPLEPTVEEEAQRLILQLKENLASTDYKVIKNEEIRALNSVRTDVAQPIELPYDPVELYEERQAWRDKIAELEKVWEE